MPHRCLTHAEAITRAATVRKLSYELDVDLTGGAERFRTITTLRFAAAEGTSTFVELRPEELIGATLNGAPLSSGVIEGRLELPDLAAENVAVITADYAYSHSSEGMHRFVDPADGAVYVYAQPSITDAPNFMAAFDQPDLKASVALSVTADPSWVVRANGEGVQESPGRWNFAATKPIATYLITLVAGPLVARYDEHDGIPLGLFARASYADVLDRHAAEIFEVTKACFDRFHELFGIRYQFGKYDQAYMPEFSWGAMEFPGCVVFRDEYLFRGPVTDTERLERAAVTAHEMAHMWFGDLVTMRWWDDLWLNESFATYMGYRLTAEVTKWKQAWTRFGAGRKLAGYAGDQRPSTHAVAPQQVIDTDDAFNNFDAISYAKGCSALRQLVAWIGDDAFFGGLRSYFEKHAWGSATLADLLAALSESSGRDVEAWAQVWLRTPGVNTLSPIIEWAADGSYASVTIEQTAPSGHPVLRPHRIGVAWRDDAGARHRTDVEIRGALTPLPALNGVKGSDLLLNAGDHTFAKVRLDERTRSSLGELIKEQPDTLARALRWGSAWDATRDALWPVEEFLDLVAAALPSEPDVTVIESVFGIARRIAVPCYLPRERFAWGLSLLERVCRSIVDGSEPGSACQLAGARGLVSCSGPRLLHDWLGGRELPPGLVVDADLRWSLLYRLAVLGQVGEAQLDAELERDHSARGEQEATRCRAARPDPAAKAHAFDIVVREQGLSNRLVMSAALGLWQPEQEELTRSYVERFFVELPRSEGRSGDLLATIVESGYPIYEVSQNTVAHAERALAGELHPLLRRALIDETDDLRRALGARAAARSA
ncbi:aminopeptidase N [Allorhizocola rhizosphaerae]|uniref:aminopeptidase N n=1 Tax=Allorhizocola rhizosphaerae TaxID=1872709 RepID=UPI000E3B7B07|nr:aminopeptidase N [Allorhizocola rhizosphaerae]